MSTKNLSIYINKQLSKTTKYCFFFPQPFTVIMAPVLSAHFTNTLDMYTHRPTVLHSKWKTKQFQ